MTDRRVRIIRRWLLLGLFVAISLRWPALWFACLPMAPIIWTRTVDGSTGILIHPDGAFIAVGDHDDSTCECCGDPCCGGGTPPAQMQLDVTITSNPCGDCKPTDGAYTLDLITDAGDRVCQSDTLPCNWQFVSTTGAFCGGTGYVLIINARADTTPDRLDASVFRHSDCAEFYRKRKTYTPIPSCETYSAESLPDVAITLGSCTYNFSVTSL